MAKTITEERDLRSLDRPGLRRTFAPLDQGERLPRELLLDGGLAARRLGRRFAALLWPAVVLLSVGLLAWATHLA
jgi:hypothetical protein